jgi:MFS family permease
VTKVGLAVHRTFHSLHSRNFRLFFFGQLVSVTGTWMQSVAAAWLVLQLTHSGVALGVQAALNFGPILVLGASAGLIADRKDKRSILIGTQIAFAILSLTMWGLLGLGVIALWEVYALTLLQGVVTALDVPTRQSFYGEMVGREDIANAVSLNSAVFTGTRIVGPAIAGVLIATVGLAPCFLIDGLSYIAVIGGLLAMRSTELHRSEGVGRGMGQLRAGLTYVWRTPELRRPLLWMAAVFTFSFNFSVLVPLYATRVFHGDAGTYGAVLAAMGVGSLAGALVMARQTRPTPRRLAWGTAVFGVASMIVAIAPSYPLALLAMLPLGFVSMVFIITANSTLQLTARPSMRGRVMALYGVIFLGSTPLGGPVAGWIAEHLGPRAAFGFGGLIALATGALGLWSVAGFPLPIGRPLHRERPEVVEVPRGTGANDARLAATDEAVNA